MFIFLNQVFQMSKNEALAAAKRRCHVYHWLKIGLLQLDWFLKVMVL